MRLFPYLNFILLFILFSLFPLFSQDELREQGLVTREPFWRQALGGAVLSLPHVQAQSAVVALDGGNIRAYSTAGTPMWSYSARGRISPFVSRSREGTSYLSRNIGILIAVNRAGRELWRNEMENPLSAKAVIGWDGRIFAPTNRKIYCYTASGNLLWTRTLEAQISIAPKLDRSGGIIFSLNNNEVYRIDPFGNAHVWMLSRTPAVLVSLNSTGGQSQPQVLVLYSDGTMEILGSAEDWFTPAQFDEHAVALPRLSAPPLAAAGRDNNVAIILNDGRTALLSLETRTIVWTGDSHIREMVNNRSRQGSPMDTEAEMIFDERGIYILSRNGATGFSHTGRRLWFVFLQNTAAIPAFGNDGVLYSGGRDWILYAFKMEDRILPERNAVFGPVPEGNYGLGRPQALYAIDIPLNTDETREKLEQIGAAISSGLIGANEPAWTSFLLNISTGQQPLQFRLAAINLLGKIGSQETVPWLLNIFRRDNEPFIRSAAVTAIGDIGVDPQGAAIQTFLHLLLQGNIRDDFVLTSIASATGALCRFSGPPLSETGIRILNLLTAANQPPMARRQANFELESLR
ncbi:MAG: PQQ-binding-like beta-propeller repeat protein [Treponema sp.]|nr:PQQ-binding-like beta-propeller repeat protein [Treponema sp.]